jgi:hypothetical protein
VAVLAVREQDAGNERAERHRQARGLEQPGGPDHDEQGRRGEGFLRTGVRDDAQHGAQQVAAGADGQRNRERGQRELPP